MNPIPNTGLPEGSARFVYLPAMVAALGGLLFGFDTAVINGAIVFIKQQFALSDSQTEIAASSLLLGCVSAPAWPPSPVTALEESGCCWLRQPYLLFFDRCGPASRFG